MRSQSEMIDKHTRAAGRAIVAKDWREQRWRFALGTLVCAGMLASLLRAQVVPSHEAALLIYWIVGVCLTIFLAMGPVAAEKADRTWEFLLAQPVQRSRVLIAKWRLVLLQFTGIMLIATLCGIAAMASRGFQGHPPVLAEVFARHGERLAALLLNHPAAWLCIIAVVATIALACWLTALFFILVRARNEFTAALGGILLTIVLHAWLAVGLIVPTYKWPAAVTMSASLLALMNPLAPLSFALTGKHLAWLPVILAVQAVVWIVLPVWLVSRYGRLAGSPAALPARHQHDTASTGTPEGMIDP